VLLNFDFDVPIGDDTYAGPVQDLTQRRELAVQNAADTIFSTLASHCPRLKVVVIESTSGSGVDDLPLRAFLKSEQISMYGQITVFGMPIEPCMAKHHEPCSEILEPDRFVFA
jgi:hypothetical protein